MKKVSVFIFLTIIYLGISGQNWETLSSANALNSITFIDDMIGFIAGNGGTILKTTDGGNTWTKINTGTNKNLTSICFTDDSTGYAFGQCSIKTTNGGKTWSALSTLPVDLYDLILSASFTDSLHGYATLQFENKLLKTEDGGKNWTLNSFEGNFLNSGDYKNTVQFIDEDHGYVLGGEVEVSSFILETSDGGLSWQQHYIHNGGYCMNLLSLQFVNDLIGYSSGEFGELYKTSNSGIDWIKLPTNSQADLYGLYFLNPEYGFTTGSSGTILKTIDGGQSWEKLSIGINSTLYSIYFIDENSGFAVGSDYTILQTTDGGINWKVKQAFENNYYNAIDFPNENIGYVAGNGGIIKKTTDGGTNWESQQPRTTKDLQSIFCIDENKVFIVGNHGTILKTTDGLSWHTMNAGTTNDLYAVYFLNKDIGYAVGENGTILMTNNAGNEWSGQTSGTLFRLNDVYFVDENMGYIVGEFDSPSMDIILKTLDGGSNWTVVSSTHNRILYSVEFTSPTSGFAVGLTFNDNSNGLIWKTKEGGNQWVEYNTNSGGYLFDADFVNDNTGYAVGDDGTIVKTTDGGVDWEQQYSGTNAILTAVSFVNDSVGYAVGNHGTILKATDTGKNGLGDVSDDLFKLFPNPASNSLVVVLKTLPKNGTLIIYSANGQEITKKQLVDLKTTININNFAKGLYIIKVVSANLASFGKFIKI
ncbi:MAG: T9SS type A sorting domain-containing protein [Bacteroidales bacterium]|nr:T9SS type A sorting domain-containing protein [Bacteroidales bacterium]